MDYFFEKIAAGTDDPKSPDGQWCGIHLKMLAENVRAFRDALQRRGLLNRSSNYEYYIAEVEYPLSELQRYWEGSGFLQDVRSADIFVHFVRQKIFELKGIAQDLDTEYQDGS